MTFSIKYGWNGHHWILPSASDSLKVPESEITHKHIAQNVNIVNHWNDDNIDCGFSHITHEIHVLLSRSLIGKCSHVLYGSQLPNYLQYHRGNGIFKIIRRLLTIGDHIKYGTSHVQMKRTDALQRYFETVFCIFTQPETCQYHMLVKTHNNLLFRLLKHYISKVPDRAISRASQTASSIPTVGDLTDSAQLSWDEMDLRFTSALMDILVIVLSPEINRPLCVRTQVLPDSIRCPILHLFIIEMMKKPTALFSLKHDASTQNLLQRRMTSAILIYLGKTSQLLCEREVSEENRKLVASEFTEVMLAWIIYIQPWKNSPICRWPWRRNRPQQLWLRLESWKPFICHNFLLYTHAIHIIMRTLLGSGRLFLHESNMCSYFKYVSEVYGCRTVMKVIYEMDPVTYNYQQITTCSTNHVLEEHKKYHRSCMKHEAITDDLNLFSSSSRQDLRFYMNTMRRGHPENKDVRVGVRNLRHVFGMWHLDFDTSGQLEHEICSAPLPPRKFPYQVCWPDKDCLSICWRWLKSILPIQECKEWLLRQHQHPLLVNAVVSACSILGCGIMWTLFEESMDHAKRATCPLNT